MLPQTFFGVAPNPNCECPPRIVSYEGTPDDGDILVYDETTDTWGPAAPNPGDITAVNTTLPLTGGATSGAVTLDINNFTGDSGAGGLDGAVPAPAAGDAAAGKFLKADGTWAVPGGGGVALTRVSLSAPIASVGAQSAVAFDTEEIDENSAWSAGSPGQFTIPSNGTYRVQISCTGFVVGTNTNYWAELQLLATTLVASNYLHNISGVPAYGWITATLTRVFSAGDVVTLLCSRLSGAGGPDMTISAGSFATLEKLA